MTIPLKWQRLGELEGEFPQAVEDNFLQIAQQFPLPPTQTHFQRAPQARVYNSATISHATTAAFQALTFDSERYDMVPAGVSEQHSTSTNTSRLTCRVPGVYSISGAVQFAANATGNRGLRIRLNGATALAGHIQPAATGGDVSEVAIETHYRLVVGDYVELMAYQSSGAALNVNAATDQSPVFGFVWHSP